MKKKLLLKEGYEHTQVLGTLRQVPNYNDDTESNQPLLESLTIRIAV